MNKESGLSRKRGRKLWETGALGITKNSEQAQDKLYYCPFNIQGKLSCIYKERAMNFRERMTTDGKGSDKNKVEEQEKTKCNRIKIFTESIKNS